MSYSGAFVAVVADDVYCVVCADVEDIYIVDAGVIVVCALCV